MEWLISFVQRHIPISFKVKECKTMLVNYMKGSHILTKICISVNLEWAYSTIIFSRRIQSQQSQVVCFYASFLLLDFYLYV